MQLNEENTLAPEESEVLPSEVPEISKNAEEVDNIQSSTLPHDSIVENSPASIQHKDESHDFGSSNANVANDIPEISHFSSRKKVNEKGETDDYTADQSAALPVRGDPKDTHTNLNSSHSVSYFFIF